jgi:hypothetical protein
MASVYDALEQQNNACSVSGNYSSNINFITEPEDGYDFEYITDRNKDGWNVFLLSEKYDE